MADWIAPPASVTWTLDPPVSIANNLYSTVTLRAPTAADALKSIAVPGESYLQRALRLISIVSAEDVPFDVLQALPMWQIEQMGSYLDIFGGAPLPGPLAQYAEAVKSAAAS